MEKEQPPTAEDSPTGAIVSPHTRRSQRVPSRQSRTKKWPALDASGPPRINLATWKLHRHGDPWIEERHSW